MILLCAEFVFVQFLSLENIFKGFLFFIRSLFTKQKCFYMEIFLQLVLRAQ